MDALLFDIPHACMVQAAVRNAIPVEVLYAIRHVERGQLGHRTVHTFADGRVAFDYGPFQLNTHWVIYFQRRYGVTPAQLAGNPCVAAGFAAYVVRYELNRARGDFWTGVGRYHSPQPERGRAYAARVGQFASRYRAAIAGWS